MKRINFLSVVLSLLFFLFTAVSPVMAHINNPILQPLNGEYNVVVIVENIANDSWIFRYNITNVNQVGEWTGLTEDNLPPDYMNHIDFTGLSNFFVKIPHGAVISNISLPESFGESQGINPAYVSEWQIYGPWQENPNDIYDWIMIYPYGFAEIYPMGETLVFSFQIDGVSVGYNEGRISTYYPDHMMRYGNDSTKLYDSYTLQMISPIVPPEKQIEKIQEEFDNAVSTGDLVGEGQGNSSKGKLNALRNMLERAAELIYQGKIDAAIQQLEDVYCRGDGISRPPDFVAGAAAASFAQNVQFLIDSLKSK
jgi:hypothetical protein